MSADPYAAIRAHMASLEVNGRWRADWERRLGGADKWKAPLRVATWNIEAWSKQAGRNVEEDERWLRRYLAGEFFDGARILHEHADAG